MYSTTLINAARTILKDFLKNKCNSPEQHILFKRMYGPGMMDDDIDVVVDNMPPDKLDWAIRQCENTKENI